MLYFSFALQKCVTLRKQKSVKCSNWSSLGFSDPARQTIWVQQSLTNLAQSPSSLWPGASWLIPKRQMVQPGTSHLSIALQNGSTEHLSPFHVRYQEMCTLQMYHKTATKTSWIWEMDLMNLNSTKHIWTYYIQFYECTSAKKDMRNCVYTHFSGGQNSSAASAFSRVELESEWIEVWLAVNYSLSWSLMPSTLAAVSQVSIESSLPKTLSPAHLLQPYPLPIPPPNTNNPSLP